MAASPKTKSLYAILWGRARSAPSMVTLDSSYDNAIARARSMLSGDDHLLPSNSMVYEIKRNREFPRPNESPTKFYNQKDFEIISRIPVDPGTVSGIDLRAPEQKIDYDSLSAHEKISAYLCYLDTKTAWATTSVGYAIVPADLVDEGTFDPASMVRWRGNGDIECPPVSVRNGEFIPVILRDPSGMPDPRGLNIRGIRETVSEGSPFLINLSESVGYNYLTRTTDDVMLICAVDTDRAQVFHRHLDLCAEPEAPVAGHSRQIVRAAPSI